MSTCPSCGDDRAYVGFSAVECAVIGCSHFSYSWLAEQPKPSDPLRGLTNTARLMDSSWWTLDEFALEFGLVWLFKITRQANDPAARRWQGHWVVSVDPCPDGYAWTLDSGTQQWHWTTAERP